MQCQTTNDVTNEVIIWVSLNLAVRKPYELFRLSGHFPSCLGDQVTLLILHLCFPWWVGCGIKPCMWFYMRQSMWYIWGRGAKWTVDPLPWWPWWCTRCVCICRYRRKLPFAVPAFSDHLALTTKTQWTDGFAQNLRVLSDHLANTTRDRNGFACTGSFPSD